MKKSLICIILAFFALLFSACGNDGRTYLDYQDGNCEIDAVFTLNGKEYAAHLSLSAPSEDENENRLLSRDMKISFTEPENLRGITVSKTKGGSGISFGNVNIPLSENMLGGFVDICSLFCIENAALDSISPIKESNVNVLKLSSERGKFTVYFDVQRRIPIQICAELGGRIIDMQITNFEKK